MAKKVAKKMAKKTAKKYARAMAKKVAKKTANPYIQRRSGKDLSLLGTFWMPFENYLGQKFLIVGFQILPEVRHRRIPNLARGETSSDSKSCQR